jgi:hypothetical protein
MKKSKITYFSHLFGLYIGLLFSQIATADPYFSPTIELSTSITHKRKIGEADIMIPLLSKNTNLSILDIKLKHDNHRSAEGNFGLINRTLIADQAIWGVYGYFDRRQTKSSLTVSQLTLGSEFLSQYLDLRANIYFPRSKKKELAPATTRFEKNGTRVYAVQENAINEVPLKGFDFEIGTPLFFMLPPVDEKLGTKIYVAKYKFHKKNIANNSGIRFRLEQKIDCDFFDYNNSEITLNLGTSWNQKKREDFFSFGVKIALDKKHKKSSLTKIQNRMMDTVIRDIDIVMQKSPSQSSVVPLYWQGKEIRNLYFVGEHNDTTYVGDGTYEKPFSRIQLASLMKEGKFVQTEYDMILPIKTSNVLTDKSYQDMINSCGAIDVKEHRNIEFNTFDKNVFPLEEMPNFFPEYPVKKIEQDLYFSLAKELKNPDVEIVITTAEEYLSHNSKVIGNNSQSFLIIEDEENCNPEVLRNIENLMNEQTTEAYHFERVNVSSNEIREAVTPNNNESRITGRRTFKPSTGKVFITDKALNLQKNPRVPSQKAVLRSPNARFGTEILMQKKRATREENTQTTPEENTPVNRRLDFSGIQVQR